MKKSNILYIFIILIIIISLIFIFSDFGKKGNISGQKESSSTIGTGSGGVKGGNSIGKGR